MADGLLVVSTLAEGPNAIVYEAKRPRDGRRFAVKELVSGAPELAIRFELEAKALARIRHPHVVEVFGASTPRVGPSRIVMPLLVGYTLADRFATSGRLSEARATALVLAMLSGLDAAHAAGILHRDVSPRNVVIGRASDEPEVATRPILIDFGLAKLRAGDPASDLSRRHPAMGEPAYVAPEQIAGLAADARTDVYSAAVVLFEALAGRPPFTGTEREVLDAHLERRAPALDRIAGVSPRLARVVAQALEKRPADRFASARAFSDALALASMGPRAAAYR